MPLEDAESRDRGPNLNNLHFPGSAPVRAAIPNVTTADSDDLTAARRGDQPALARLYDRHAPVVLALCRARFPYGSADPDDATQETFIRAFSMLAKLQDSEKLRPWLYGIARNVCAERTRATNRRVLHERQTMMPTQIQDNSRLDGQDVASQSEQQKLLDDALRQLGDDERLAIHLHYLDADPVRASLAALGLSRGGYYKLLDRARNHLAQLMCGEPKP